ncbi:hypothetical protein PR202_gb11711 [Eleusine coracana subsp. coracana]|uniref:Auxin-responsive protein n=1 Tax=Eleusine coracana subsp. coracana TaxID=191504 RepID=A0AAV5ENN1_ELECO|nr:hypothetical protein PR202_gb11711 [Eleusine coracana subsp. coracana]
MACLGFDETELRLGLPGGGNDAEEAARSSGKRAFEDTIDLKLKLEQPAPAVAQKDEKDEEEEAAAAQNVVHAATPLLSTPAASVATGGGNMKRSPSLTSVNTAVLPDPEKPRAPKAQAVGWPPVRSFRKNIISVHSQKGKADDNSGDKSGTAAFVKVSMDGAPYLRKVDLRMYGSYQELSMALEKMFSSFTIGSCGSQGMTGMNESKLADLLSGSDYVPTYEDKDGDWMLVGDVPWEMFVESCKRLRIMKGSEAVGLGQSLYQQTSMMYCHLASSHS